jgi:glutathione synthase/RimK-type ligase-like ATP-grasp enzyme
MKIAIHKSRDSFAERWISHCINTGIEYKLVNCYSIDIIKQLEDCDALMWHFQHASAKDTLFAKQLLYSIQAAGKKVFPNYNTMWHFDDKVGQKYLLEAIGAPLVSTWIFYNKKEVLKWVDNTTFPKVFKLRGGAGSENVQLVNTKRKANRLVNKAFGRGFSQYQGWSNLKERYRKYKIGRTTLWDLIKGVIRLFHPTKFAKVAGREKGYLYFQDFIPDNNYDIRVVVIGGKAFAIKRLVRENDFRASGSGAILYDKEHFNEEDIRLAFNIHTKLNSQCTAMDFIYEKGQPRITEISYGFVPTVYDPCPGYWDNKLNWHPGSLNPYGWMVDEIAF